MKQIKTPLVVLLALLIHPFSASPQTLPERSVKAPAFTVSNISAIRALIELSRFGRTPLGIIEGDRLLCTTLVTYKSEKPESTASIVQKIAAQVPGYTSRSFQNGILVLPNIPPPVTTQILNLVDPRYGPMNGSPSMLIATLWVHVRYLLHPDQATAMSVLGTPGQKSFEVEARDENVERILNRIASATRSLWILRPLPNSLQSVGPENPFLIFPEDGNFASDRADLCKPVEERP